ncbi:hypothetical protein LguiB_034057 [Lonicera macranthoides]
MPQSNPLGCLGTNDARTMRKLEKLKFPGFFLISLSSPKSKLRSWNILGTLQEKK